MTTPVYGHADIPMRRMPDGKALHQLGDFCWAKRPQGWVIIIAIPCKSKSGWVHSEWSIDFKNASDAQWTRGGDWDQPTLSPSLHAVGVWHGYVRAGKLVEAR